MSTLRPHQWQELSPYLDQALELTDQQRALWLSSLRVQNPALADQLTELLDEHRSLSHDGFLENRTVELPGTELAGQGIGAYTLISEIGQGGMGTVWLAARNDGRFERQVAVKFLNIALMGKRVEERFKREGSILARLSHPHIAELLDAGLTHAGQPYLVLEHVQGDHIDRHCDERRLGVDARVRLFLEVLDAVAHAHANLIVHRDIKPSNVLVRNDGHAKLLDFGIAKLLEGEGHSGEATQLTMEAGGAMTPEYAAPEQLKGEPVTTATDVYALGVLLYVLLTGQHPTGAGPHNAADLVRSIVDTEPRRPSETVTATRANGKNSLATASRRGTTPDKLRRVLRGDLDTILAKTLKKEPAERYSSVSALADDLRRYLKHEPISARPDALAYRARKFVRRNRVVVALVGMAIAATVAGIVGTVMQAREARSQRDFAIRQLVRSQNTIDFNEFLLSDAAPSGKPFTVNELLDRAESVLARQSAADVDSRTQLMVYIGDQYSTQDQPAKARRILEEAHTLSRTLDDRSTRAEASCSLAGALARDGEMVRAEALIQEGLHDLPANSQYDLDRIFCLRRGSEVAQESGDAQQGIARMQSAWAILKRSPFDSDTLELHPLLELAESYRMAGQNQRADSTFEEAAAMLYALGRDNTQSAVALFNDWALALDRLGRPLEAEKLYRRAIDVSRAGPTEEAVSPMILKNYSSTLRQLGRLDEAADYAERAHAKAVRNDDQEVIYNTLYMRALIYSEQHKFQRAQSMLTELEPRIVKTFPPDHYWFGALASAKALLAAGKGDYATALPLADRGVDIVQAAIKAGRAGRDFLPLALMRRSTVEMAAGRPAQAADDAQAALNQLRAASVPGAFSSLIGRSYLLLGNALQAEGKHQQASAAFHSAAENLQSTVGPDHPDTRAARHLAELEAQHP